MVKNKIKNVFKKLELKDLIIFLIPFVVFITALIIFYPGFLSYDSYQQIAQIRSNTYQSWHPFIHTFIEKICMKIWNSPASVGLFQILCFSTLWTVICKYNRKSKTKLEFIIQIIVTLIISFNPLNICYSITLWKDILFSYGMLLLCFIIEIIVDKKYTTPNYIVVILGILMAFLSKIRFNGLFAIIIFLFILIPILLKNKKIKQVLLMLSVFLISFLSIIGLELIYKVENNSKSALNTKMMHVIAYYELQGYLDEKDHNVISKAIDIDEMKNQYEPSFLDPIYSITNQDAAKKYRSELLKIVFKNAIKHPKSFIKYAFSSSVMTWSINLPEDTVGLTLYLSVNAQNNVENIRFKNENKQIFQKVKNSIEYTVDNKLTHIILYSMSLYMYLTIIIFILIIIITKRISYLLVIIPNLINVVVVAASTPVQDIRYIYSNVLIFYISLLIINSCVLKKGVKK